MTFIARLLPTPISTRHDDGVELEFWTARRERMRDRYGVGIGTPPLPLLLPLLSSGAPTGPPSSSGSDSPTPPRGQLTIEAGIPPSSSSGCSAYPKAM